MPSLPKPNCGLFPLMARGSSLQHLYLSVFTEHVNTLRAYFCTASITALSSPFPPTHESIPTFLIVTGAQWNPNSTPDHSRKSYGSSKLPPLSKTHEASSLQDASLLAAWPQLSGVAPVPPLCFLSPHTLHLLVFSPGVSSPVSQPVHGGGVLPVPS